MIKAIYGCNYTNRDGKTDLQVYLESLADIDLGDGVIVPAWESVSSIGTPNIQASNNAMVEVYAPQQTIDDLDGRYTRNNDRDALDKNGEPDETKRNAYRAKVKTLRSDERKRKGAIQKKLNKVTRLITKNDEIIARKDAFRANREAKRVTLVTFKATLVEVRDGTFSGDIETVVTEFETLFSNTNKFIRITDDSETVYTKAQMIAGLRKPFKVRINLLIDYVDDRKDNHVDAKQRLIAEIAGLTKATRGTLDEGDNLETIELALEAELAGFPK